jgi:hypothetical protein
VTVLRAERIGTNQATCRGVTVTGRHALVLSPAVCRCAVLPSQQWATGEGRRQLAVMVKNPAIPSGWFGINWLARSGGHSLAAYALAASERRT